MIKEIKTIKDATREFVKELNAIDRGIIERLMQNNIDEWTEVTMPCEGNRVYVIDECEEGEIIDIITDDSNDLLPMWGTMWSFDDIYDDLWLEEKDGIKKMSECGFRIYQHEEYGYFFGIDGAGYDFYEAHWIPLYKARGMIND